MQLRDRLLIFDLDGTLVDSASDIAEALNLTLADFGLRQVDEAVVRGWIGEGVRTLTETALRDQHSTLELDAVMPTMMHHYAECLLHRPRVYPGVAEALAALQAQGNTLAVCTNKPSAFVAPLLEHLGLDGLFAALVGGDTLPERKPSAVPLLHLAAQFQRGPGDCVMIGDSATDAAAARNAGMPLVMVRYGYLRGFDPDTAGAVAVVGDLRELLLPAPR